MIARADVAPALRAALPVMLGYVTIGVPCGVMASEVGLGPAVAFLLSATFYSGAGQFMMASLALAGVPLASMIASVALVSTRQLLYSAALSPYLARAPRPLATLFAATVTDESFGVNLDRFVADDAWTPTRATIVNLASMLSWALANALGAAVGPALAIPTAIMSFAMTSIFVCLLVAREWTVVTVVVVAVAAAVVALLKLLGLGSLSVLLGALAGVASGMAVGAGRRGSRERA
ncbi:AzlC family ABC transporter permease [Olsenella uli]|uniref:AzlC family ABC transporter permease n=1 Tax=Olsenella uli TaxID=133926 RepID=UPI00315CEBB2